MRALSGLCSICLRRTLRPLTGDLFICVFCDTAASGTDESRRGCPPNMPGGRGGYTVVGIPTTTTEEQS